MFISNPHPFELRLTKTRVLLCFLLFSLSSDVALLGIGNQALYTSAILELSSTDQGLLPPRITAAQRDAISLTPQGGINSHLEIILAPKVSLNLIKTPQLYVC